MIAMQLFMPTFFAQSFFLFFQEVVSQGRFATALEKAQHPDLSKFLIIGALLFIIGVAGVLTRRNIIVIFMSIELILNAANQLLRETKLSSEETIDGRTGER